MTGWHDLARELDLWAEAGRRATLWWRDDDATEETPALARLVELSQKHGVPLALAVVPAKASETLVRAVAGAGAVALQHGYAHASHAAPGSKTGELAPTRPIAVNLRELAEGWQRLSVLFGAAALPVLVPPWNRIDPALIPYLPGLGFRGLSTYGARAEPMPATGLLQANTHLDIIDWRGGRGFVGEAKALDQLLAHLRARRQGHADAAEASGLLTHHLAHDPECWAFIDGLFARSRGHRGARWLGPAEIFDAASVPMPQKASVGR